MGLLTGNPDNGIIYTYTGSNPVTSQTEITRSKASLIPTMEGVVGNNVTIQFPLNHTYPFKNK